MSAGIDYGNGLTNIDHESGIRYGVIHSREVGQAWYDESESNYGEPTCGQCGEPAIESADIGKYFEVEPEWFKGKDYACITCERSFWSDEAYGDEPLSHTYSDADYDASQGGDDCDIFVTRSPFYTFAPFCSPCAPGAGYLGSAIEPDKNLSIVSMHWPKVYCFGHDWYEDGKAPYRVFRVADDVEVFPNAS